MALDVSVIFSLFNLFFFGRRASAQAHKQINKTKYGMIQSS